MTPACTYVCVGVLALLAGCAVGHGPQEASLFNGRDLAGWRVVSDARVTDASCAAGATWSVVGGAIRTTGSPFGYLRTVRDDYGDFRLRLAYRWWRVTDKPNSGVFVRLTREHGSFIPTCVENQLCRTRAGEVLGLGGMPIAGKVPNMPFSPEKPLSGIVKFPRQAADSERPMGEWNILEIELDGDTLVNRVNGVEQNRVTGIAAQRGAIALQSEGGAIEFRDISIESP